jgi:hypothetical protein
MKAIIRFFYKRPVRTIVGLSLIAVSLLAGMSGMGVLLTFLGAVILTD